MSRNLLKILLVLVGTVVIVVPTTLAQLSLDGTSGNINAPELGSTPDTPLDDLIDQILYEVIPYVDERVVEPLVGEYLPDDKDGNITISNETNDPAEDGAAGLAEKQCSTTRATLRSKGVTDNRVESASSPTNNEFDALAGTGSCAGIRDDVEDQVYDSTGAPRERQCRMVAGRDTCIAVRYPDCDAYVYLMGGILRMCLGGVFPTN